MGENNFDAILAAVEAGTALLIDVRTQPEYEQGHIPGSINIPLERLPYANIEDGKQIYAYCLSGSRSERACLWLRDNNYDAVNAGAIDRYKGKL